MNPYINNIIMYPLEADELSLIDKLWDFLTIFRKTYLTKSSYMNNIAKIIQKIYIPQDFLLYEKLAEKLYWNLVFVMIDKLNIKSTIRKKKTINKIDIKNKILQKSISRTIGETTINKTFVATNKAIYYKYEYPNDLDKLMYSVMINRSLYETIMSNIDKISLQYLSELEIEPYNNFIEFDYGFPNLNTIRPFAYTDNVRLENITKMYWNT